MLKHLILIVTNIKKIQSNNQFIQIKMYFRLNYTNIKI